MTAGHDLLKATRSDSRDLPRNDLQRRNDNDNERNDYHSRIDYAAVSTPF